MNKRQYSLRISLLFAAVALMAFTFSNGDNVFSVMSSGGAPAGYSGDPAGGNKNCTNCHSGSDARSQSGWITSDIPGTGYEPGVTYTITSTASGSGVSKFGFQVSPQNSGGTVLGTLVNTGAETKLVSGTDYVTQTSSGNTGSDSKTWTFDWTAPHAGSGDVTFYGAFNLADNNGSSSGDDIVLSTLTINESASTGVHSQNADDLVSVYPNPAREYLTIESANVSAGSRFIMYDPSGRRVMTGLMSGQTTTIAIGQLNPGMYYLHIEDSEGKTIEFLKE